MANENVKPDAEVAMVKGTIAQMGHGGALTISEESVRYIRARLAAGGKAMLVARPRA
jgi:hypothetical protein